MLRKLRIELEQTWNDDGYLMYSLLIDGKKLHNDDKDFSDLRGCINDVLQKTMQVGLVSMKDIKIDFIE